MGITPEEPNGALRVAGDEWARAMVGLTKPQVTAGLDACRMSGRDWPPSSSEFRAMCLGIPELNVVRDEIDTRSYSRFSLLVLRGGVDSNGVRWPGLDWSRYRSEPAKGAMAVLKHAYDRAHDHVMRGGQLPELPVAAIEQEPREFKPADPAKVADHFAQLERVLGVGRPDSPGVPA
jgi:hypothetical protein